MKAIEGLQNQILLNPENLQTRQSKLNNIKWSWNKLKTEISLYVLGFYNGSKYILSSMSEKGET